MTLRLLLHWWAAYGQIGIPATSCPPDPSGNRQAAAALIQQGDWLRAFDLAFWVAVIVAVGMVLVTYQTRVVGEVFVKRWYTLLLVTMLIASLIVLGLLLTVPVQTFGCSAGNVTTRIPLLPALSRASVAFVQAGLEFYVVSWLLCRAARISKFQPWYHNSRFPRP